MDTVIRVVVIYLFLLIGMRVLGKREFGQLSPQEFVILLIIPEMVSTALNQSVRSLLNAILGVCTIFTLVFATSMLKHRFPKVEKVIADAEAVLVHNGTVFKDVLDNERVTPEEIMSEAHKAGIENIEEVRWAILGSDGKIAVIPKERQGFPQEQATEPSGSQG
jgi:uncharacterized membrane protein YcaP (DUF421 family)